MAVPNIFGTATAAIPLSQLDTNFATPVTIGNTAVQLGNTVTSFGNVTLTNVTVSSGNVTITGANVSGNLTFTGTGNRITGDFSNATLANRLLIQNSVTNSATNLQTIPNGTGTQAGFIGINNSDPTNASFVQVGVTNIDVRLVSAITGTGTYLPMTFSTGGSERVRIDTSGNVGIGTSSPSYKLHVANSSATSTTLLANVLARLQSNASGADASLQFSDNVTNSAGISLNQGSLVTSIAGGEVMRVNTSGNVGIGTASPTALRTRNLEVSSSETNDGAAVIVNKRGTGIATMRLGTVGGATGFDINFNFPNTGDLGFYDLTAATTRMSIDSSGGLILAGSTAQKATGTTWSNPSDQRLKDNIRDYGKGLAELMQVRVREWEYNGKGGTVEGTKGLGVVADEVITVLPDTVENYDAKLNADDEEATAIKKFDATEITWLLVKTVQEQQALIQSLTTRITALENK